MANALHFSAQATPAWGDLGLYDAVSRARVNGLAFTAILNLSTWEECGIGWHGSAAVADPDSFVHALQANTTDGQLDNNHGQLVLSGLSLNTDYPVAFVTGATRSKMLVRVAGSWKLAWVGTATTTPLYAAFANLDAVGYLDTLKEQILDAPFSTDYGLATDRLAGAVSEGATFTHEADCVIEWTQTTLPSGGTQILRFRKQDNSNHWVVYMNSSGTLTLSEVISGTPTARGEAVSVVSNNHRIVVVCDGSTIRVYSNNVLRITYSSASNFATATDGQLVSLGTGGAVSDLVAWPRQLSGSAANILDQSVA